MDAFNLRFIGTNYFRRYTYNEGIRRNRGVFQHNRTGSDDGTGTDMATAENDGTHANEDIIFQGGSVNDGTVTDGYEIAEYASFIVIYMEYRVVLYIGVATNDNFIYVAASSYVLPEGGVFLSSTSRQFQRPAWGKM